MQHDNILQLIVRVLAILTCFPVHESAHAWMADKLGDPTGKDMGRISLNPRVHMDMWGTICFLLLGIGYAKPVPVDIRNFKNPKRDFALTAVAGPLSNLIMAFLSLLVLKAVMRSAPGLGVLNLIISGLIYCAYINISLAVFNLIPIPPLDGSRLVTALLPDRLYAAFLKYEKYSGIALLALIFLLNRLGISPISAVSGFIFDGFVQMLGL